MSSRKQAIALTELQLIKRAHSDDDAAKALDRYYEIEKAGGTPIIRFSKFNGYSVIDRDDFKTTD